MTRQLRQSFAENWQAYLIVVLLSGATGTGAGLVNNKIDDHTREYVQGVIDTHEEEGHKDAATLHDLNVLCRNQQIIAQMLVAGNIMAPAQITCGGD